MTEATEKKILFVDEFVDETRVANDVAVGTDLNAEFIRQPSLVYYYTSMAAKAEFQVSDLKLKLETVEALAASEIRKVALEEGEKLTADMVKDRVRVNPKTVRLEQALIKARLVESTLKGVVEALRHKRDSLYSIGMNNRDEMKAKITLEDSFGSDESRTARRSEAVKDRMRSKAA